MGLFEQYDRIKIGPAPARNSTGSINVAVLYSAISQAMAVCGDRKDYGKVLKLLDFNLEAARGSTSGSRRGKSPERGGPGMPRREGSSTRPTIRSGSDPVPPRLSSLSRSPTSTWTRPTSWPCARRSSFTSETIS